MSAGTCIDYLIKFEFGDGAPSFFLLLVVANDAHKKRQMNE